MQEDLDQVLVTEAQIERRIAELGAEINEAYGPHDEVAVIAVVNGAVIFVADLIRQLHINLQLDCIRVSSYQDDTEPVSLPEIHDRIRLDLRGLRVLIIDDILDTGQTLSMVV